VALVISGITEFAARADVPITDTPTEPAVEGVSFSGSGAKNE